MIDKKYEQGMRTFKMKNRRKNMRKKKQIYEN